MIRCIFLIIFSFTLMNGGIYAQSYDNGYENKTTEQGREKWWYNDLDGRWYLISVVHGPGSSNWDIDGSNPDGSGGVGDDDGWYDDGGWGDDGWVDSGWDEEWTSGDETNVSVVGGNPAPCPRLVGRTRKLPDRKRKRIGIGEEVMIKAKNSCGADIEWLIEGEGVFTSLKRKSCSFQAKFTPGVVRITAVLSHFTNPNCSDCPSKLELEYEVVAPESIMYELGDKPNYVSCIIPPGKFLHIKFKPSAGWWFNNYVQPSDVNFYNVYFQESDAAPEGKEKDRPDGPYWESPWGGGPPLYNAVPNHPLQQPDKATEMVVTGKGTILNSDLVYQEFFCRNCCGNTGPVQDYGLEGTVKYRIEQYYGGSYAGPFTPFTITEQIGHNEGNYFTVSKHGATQAYVKRRVDDDTYHCLLFNPLTLCH